MTRLAARACMAPLMLCLLAAPRLGHAEIVVFEFTAQVTSSDVPGVNVGAPIGGIYVFDGATLQIGAPPGVGRYWDAMRFARVELPGDTVRAIPPPDHFANLTEIRTNDFALNNAEDESYRAGMENLAPLNDGLLSDFVVELSSTVDTAEIDGTALPVVPPDIDAFEMAEVAIFFPDQTQVTADLITLPEPAGATSAALVLASLAVWGRRRLCGG